METSLSVLKDREPSCEKGPTAAPTPRAEIAPHPGERRRSEKQEKQEKKTKKKQTEPTVPAPPRFGRGVETMYRNAYRLKLDLMTLADGKANIMLSINSISFTILMLGSGFIATTEPWLLAPIGVFLVSSVCAMVFAVLAVRPHVQKSKVTRDGLLAGQGSLLYFNNFTKLSSHEYVRTLESMLSDNSRIYNQMARTVYGLGVTVDRKFRLLKISYSVFLGGLVLTAAAFALARSLSLGSTPPVETVGATVTHPARLESGIWHAFEEIYEPSGAQQLPDGRVVVVEDEKTRPLSLLSLVDAGTFSERRIDAFEVSSSGLGPLDDLEGVDVTDRGDVYAITSHARTRDGDIGANRQKLVRLRLEGDRISAAAADVGLKAALARAHPSLARAARTANSRHTLGFNIEGLAFDEGQNKLLVGFRTPLVGGKALVATIDNPHAVFDRGEAPRIAPELAYLDLDGGGIRSMAFDERLGGFLIVGRGESSFRLWLWNGRSDRPAREVKVRGLESLGRAEGIAPVRFEGEERLLVVSDDGNAAAGKPGHYVLLDYDQLIGE